MIGTLRCPVMGAHRRESCGFLNISAMKSKYSHCHQHTFHQSNVVTMTQHPIFIFIEINKFMFDPVFFRIANGGSRFI